MKQMMNFNILAKEIKDENEGVTAGGLFIPTASATKNYVELEVIKTYDEKELPEGSIISVMKGVGIQYGENVIVNRRDVLMYK